MNLELEAIPFASLTDIATLLRTTELTSVALTEQMLARIEQMNPKLNAFITVTPTEALAQAHHADIAFAQGRDFGPLHGIPIAVKDLFATQGIRTTSGTKLYANWIPQEDATVIRQLKALGAVILGKTGLHELAWGSTSINPHYGAIRNPWHTDYHPGGSSGGSAVAVAAGLAYAALGTDTGCSVRQPAHCCGIVGHKPTFGLVSKAGVTPLCWSLDHVGFLTRTVRDTALLQQHLAAYDPADPYSVRQPAVDYVAMLERPLPGIRIGVPHSYFFEGGDPEVGQIVLEAASCLEALGATIVDVSLPNLAQVSEAVSLTFAEAVAAHGTAWRQTPEGFSQEMLRQFEHTAKISGAEYAQAQQSRQQFRQAVTAVMTQCDLLLTPTSSIAAEPIAAEPSPRGHERPKNTRLFNFTGQPSISVPCGFTQTGLPVGLMLTGRMFEDATVLRAAHAFEQATCWHVQRPPIDKVTAVPAGQSL
ncbi:amidase [Candidatus Leptofilum sp.]|uniref:amidase n=1 Tax=Candidatus Leptofilum sp. TaxID=3241576 RepID=UPI003B5A9199